MKATVNPELCISCGMCVGVEPDVFRFNDEDKSEAYGEVTRENQENVQAAIDGCPVDAISWKEK